ncbi:MAG TPA: phenylalanine--tRNA ligase subunit beta [Thermoplasmata archaeon]|nr:phenylalanine--tRNA ligase subunit beta [Thermoplasmata archaeon]
MPVIKVKHSELSRLVGRDLKHSEIEELAYGLAGEVEGVEGEEISLKWEPIRPDLFSVEGFARACRGLLGLQEGALKYVVAPPRWTLRIDSSVRAVRPVMVAARITDVKLSDETVRSIVDLQEKLDASIGRGRKRVSIGLHDPSNLHPPFEYRCVPWEASAFIPLGHSVKMTPKEIVEKHEGGKQHGQLISAAPAAPILVDSRGQVLSLPPIINGELTRVTSQSKELFLDVTGLEHESCRRVLNIICCALADRGASIEAVSIAGEGATKHESTPDLSSERWELPFSAVTRVLGAPATPREAAAALRRAGHDANENGPLIEVDAPAYRADILHVVDLVEDVAIGLGYDTIPTSLPRHAVFARRLGDVGQEDSIASSLIGQGFTEISTLMVSNAATAARNFETPGVGAPAPGAAISNPITMDHTHLRASLLPDLMNSFRINRHRDMPQRIFEIGLVFDGSREHRRAGFAAMHARASFTECKSHAESLLRDLRVVADVDAAAKPGFISGRCASAIVAGKEVGFFGEIHPAVLENFELAAPVIACEVDIARLFP